MLSRAALVSAFLAAWIPGTSARSEAVCERTVNQIIIYGHVIGGQVTQQSAPPLNPGDLEHLCRRLRDEAERPGGSVPASAGETEARNAELARKLAINEQMLEAALRIAQEAGSNDEARLVRRFSHAMGREARTKSDFEAEATDDATVSDLLRRGVDALKHGDLTKAEAIAAEVRVARVGLVAASPPTTTADYSCGSRPADPAHTSWWSAAMSFLGFGDSKPISPICLDETVAFRNQHGREVNISRDGATLKLVTFAYTRSQCVAALNILQAAALTLGDSFNLSTYFVSFDSERDTPAVLRAFAARAPFQALTGREGDIARFARPLRVYYRSEKAPDGAPVFSHTTATYIFDRQNRFQGLISPDESDEEILRKILAARRISDTSPHRRSGMSLVTSANANGRDQRDLVNLDDLTLDWSAQRRRDPFPPCG